MTTFDENDVTTLAYSTLEMMAIPMIFSTLAFQ
jgi:hypothetical protein